MTFMGIELKTTEQIDKMRVAGRMAARVLEMIGEHVVVGSTTEDLDRVCHEFIVDELDAVPAPLNYSNAPGQPPFPKSICTSVNHVVCHGIPSAKKKLKRGDVLNIDVTVVKDGFHGASHLTGIRFLLKRQLLCSFMAVTGSRATRQTFDLSQTRSV